jgi:hypothetical protein
MCAKKACASVLCGVILVVAPTIKNAEEGANAIFAAKSQESFVISARIRLIM